MLTPAQMRAARGLLDWTRADLAKACGLSQETIKNVEHGSYRPQETTMNAIVQAFAAHDVELTENEGIRRRRELVKTFYGKEGFRSFFDQLYETTKATQEEICIFGVEEKLFIEHLGDYSTVHIKRMTDIKAKVRCLIKEGDNDVYCDDYNEYKWVSASDFSSVPFYIFSDKFAVIIFEPNLTVVQVESAPVAAAYKRQFAVLWEKARAIKLRRK